MDFNIKILVLGDENSDKTDYWGGRICTKTYEFRKHIRQNFDAIGTRQGSHEQVAVISN